MASSSDADKKSKADRAKADRANLPFEPKGSRKGAAKGKTDSSDAKAKRDSAKQSSKKSSSAQKSDQKSAQKSAKKGGKSASKSASSGSKVSASAQAQVDEIRAMNRRKSEKFLAEKAEAKKSGRKRSGVASAGRADNSGAIPEAVSRRMLRRMAILSGSPVALGVGIFFLAYYLRSNEIVEFAPIVVLLSTMGCFGLGVLGLTYGVLSASWDSEPGSLVGFSEFKLNFGRVMDARRASKT